MAWNTSSLSGMINERYIISLVEAYTKQKVIDSIFSEGGMDEESGWGRNLFNAPTKNLSSFPGNAAKIAVPIVGNVPGSVTALTDGADEGAESSYVPEVATVTLREYGKYKWTVSGLASLETYDSALEAAISAATISMQNTKELLIANATAGQVVDTKIISEASDPVRFFKHNGTKQTGETKYYPANGLTEEAIFNAKALMKGDPFDNGLYLGIVHQEVVPTMFQTDAGTRSIYGDFQAYGGARDLPPALGTGILGVYHGILWIAVNNPSLKVSGVKPNDYVYRTIILGKAGLAKAYVDPQWLIPADMSIQQIPVGDFVVRVVPDASDVNRRQKIVSAYFVGGYAVGHRDSLLVVETLGASVAGVE